VIVREQHWAPEQVGALYFDGQDYQGLLFWYNDVIEVQRQIKAATKK
jgi:hypothetical protein